MTARARRPWPRRRRPPSLKLWSSPGFARGRLCTVLMHLPSRPPPPPRGLPIFPIVGTAGSRRRTSSVERSGARLAAARRPHLAPRPRSARRRPRRRLPNTGRPPGVLQRRLPVRRDDLGLAQLLRPDRFEERRDLRQAPRVRLDGGVEVGVLAISAAARGGSAAASRMDLISQAAQRWARRRADVVAIAL